MKRLVIYHANCTDGFGAAFAAWLAMGDTAEYIPVDYGNPIPCEVAGRSVHILDFSFPAEVMKDIIQQAEYVVWLDHHKTAFENWAGDERQLYVDETEYTYIVLDNNKSGAMLSWKYFHPGTKVPDWVHCIDDRDRWQFKINDSKSFHAGMAARKPWTFDQWRTDVGSDYLTQIVFEGSILLAEQERQVKSMAKKARSCDLVVKHYTHEDDLPEWHHYLGLAINTNIHMSEIGHELANAGLTYGLIWYVDQDNKVKCSLRSNGDYDVSLIARAFGGGGHKNAAGFSTDINTLMGWLK